MTTEAVKPLLAATEEVRPMKRSEMTSDELKQYNKEAQRRARAKKAIASGDASFNVMVASWTRHEAQLKKENPTLHATYQKQHQGHRARRARTRGHPTGH